MNVGDPNDAGEVGLQARESDMSVVAPECPKR
jgi:hypothetical protein